MGRVADVGSKSGSKQHTVLHGIRDGGKEEGNTSQCEEHVGSCQHRRKELQATRATIYLFGEEMLILLGN